MDNIDIIKKYIKNRSFRWYSGLYSIYTALLHDRKSLTQEMSNKLFNKKKDSFLAKYRIDNIFENHLKTIEITNNGEISMPIQKQEKHIKNEIDCIHIIEELIDHKKQQQEKKIAFVMAPIFNNENINDGYYRRIKMVDDILCKDYCRFYVSSLGYNGKSITYKKIDENLYMISYDVNNFEEANAICRLGEKIDLLYHHSVGYINKWIIRNPKITKIVDLHGALPEELHMYGKHFEAQNTSINEEIALKYADYIICVTKAMQKHILKKYPNTKAKFIIMPILDEGLINYYKNKKIIKDNKKTIVTYAGGVQKWQRIPYMQELIYSRLDEHEFLICVPKPNEFNNIWEYSKKIPFSVESKTVNEIKEVLNKCDYGFALRENSVVNKVACPTKLVEYLLAGVIPILESKEIGDFVEDGMLYVSDKDFLKGNLPNKKERQKIINANRLLVEKMVNNYHKGVSEIERIVNK